MRYRALDQNGDFSFGRGGLNFLQDSPEAVAQHVKTRLLLSQGEWFLDVNEGTPWNTQILGEGTMNTYNLAIRERILGTQGVTEISAYSSTLNRDTRQLAVTATISTIYGATTFEQVLQ